MFDADQLAQLVRYVDESGEEFRESGSEAFVAGYNQAVYYAKKFLLEYTDAAECRCDYTVAARREVDDCDWFCVECGEVLTEDFSALLDELASDD